jgi:hypothetical protein
MGPHAHTLVDLAVLLYPVGMQVAYQRMSAMVRRRFAVPRCTPCRSVSQSFMICYAPSCYATVPSPISCHLQRCFQRCHPCSTHAECMLVAPPNADHCGCR